MTEPARGPISGDDVKLVIVKKKPKATGPGYSTDEIDDLLNTPVSSSDVKEADSAR